MSLKEVERYVSENRKLPGLPSARTIKSEGLDVGFMQAKMLEKMEELVLYVILLERKFLHWRNSWWQTANSST